MKKVILIAVVIISAIVMLMFFLAKPHPLAPSPERRGGTEQVTNEPLPITATVSTGTEKIYVRIADDVHERELGLSYFKTLPADQGMLFLFDRPGNYPFWMKGMNFPIDIIWLKRVSENSFEVVYVAENVDPATYPNNIDPKREADAVLEVNAGQATVHNLLAKNILWISTLK